MPRKRVIWTIGHSTHPIDEFIDILRAHEIQAIADVRSIPKSRHVPWFNAENLSKSLRKAGIAYLPFLQLGGRRHAKKDSINTAWRNASFRGYADYMQTPEFREGLKKLEEIAKQEHVAMMCAEAVPWRCHRSMIADALVVRGWLALEITGKSRAKEHKLTSFAKVHRKRVTYPGEETLFQSHGDEAAQATKKKSKTKSS